MSRASCSILVIGETTGGASVSPPDSGRTPWRFKVSLVFLSRMAPAVTLKSDRSERFVTLSYPDMPYLGIWHDAQTPAPYVCIEPWCGLPDFDGRSTELVAKAQMFHLLPHTSKTVGFSMIFG